MRFFTVIILSGILCLFCFQMAQSAEIKVVDNSVFVETDAYEIQFSDGVITQLYNKLTGEAYTLPLGGGGGPTGIRGRSGVIEERRQIYLDRPNDANRGKEKSHRLKQKSCFVRGKMSSVCS